ncbi:MAG: hypothetical protein KGJ89_00635 [Patescibacteria group bacterium]|nr:hypothetical protein [Patescibacteria group bacterium]MDE2015020.1 hypothetical protein [Patescibacteria group bacterium]MDE2226448.1 hypothetical protein [Patescibacteria group bacterium]
MKKFYLGPAIFVLSLSICLSFLSPASVNKAYASSGSSAFLVVTSPTVGLQTVSLPAGDWLVENTPHIVGAGGGNRFGGGCSIYTSVSGALVSWNDNGTFRVFEYNTQAAGIEPAHTRISLSAPGKIYISTSYTGCDGGNYTTNSVVYKFFLITGSAEFAVARTTSNSVMTVSLPAGNWLVENTPHIVGSGGGDQSGGGCSIHTTVSGPLVSSNDDGTFRVFEYSAGAAILEPSQAMFNLSSPGNVSVSTSYPGCSGGNYTSNSIVYKFFLINGGTDFAAVRTSVYAAPTVSLPAGHWLVENTPHIIGVGGGDQSGGGCYIHTNVSGAPVPWNSDGTFRVFEYNTQAAGSEPSHAIISLSSPGNVSVSTSYSGCSGGNYTTNSVVYKFFSPGGSITVNSQAVSSNDPTTGTPLSASWQFPYYPSIDPCSISSCSGTSATYDNLPTGANYTVGAPVAPTGYVLGSITSSCGSSGPQATCPLNGGGNITFTINWITAPVLWASFDSVNYQPSITLKSTTGQKVSIPFYVKNTGGGELGAICTLGSISSDASASINCPVDASGQVTGSTLPVTISISSPTAVVLRFGETHQFQAVIGSGTTNTAVTWSVSPASGCGSITAGGLYTAPSIKETCTVTVASNADPTKTASATVTMNNIIISVSPTTAALTLAPLQIKDTQSFSAAVDGTINTAVTWSVSPASGCGSVSPLATSGNPNSVIYTAPSSVAVATTCTVTATSNADPTVSSSATFTINPVIVSIAPTSATVPTNGNQSFSATVGGDDDTSVTWSLSPVSGCGSVSPLTTATSTDYVTYTAPSSVATGCTVTATSNADPTKSSIANITLQATQASIAVTISPSSATLPSNGSNQKQFNASINGTVNNSGVTWSVSPATGCGSVSSGGLYTAPSSAATCTVTATSNADSTKSASATVTVNSMVVTISPTSATLSVGNSQQFNASINGTVNNSGVTWSVSPATGCGTVSNIGSYTAPSSVTVVTTCTVTAKSIVDSTKTASATVTVNPVTITISPTTAGVKIGGTKTFTIVVGGTTNTSFSYDDTCAGSLNFSSGNYWIYTPNGIGTCTLTVTSDADPSKYAQATITVTDINGGGGTL